MKKLIIIIGVIFFNFTNLLSQAPTLSLLNSYSLTPNPTDTIGAFARIYYHQPRNKFYTIYAARPAGSALPSGMLTNFAWREYDINMNFTGNKGTLPGFTGAGDFACVMVDSTYYHLTNLGSTTSGVLKYKLTKMDDNFATLATQTITLNARDSNIDQLLNYTNGRLIIGAMQDSSAMPPTTPPLPTYNPNVHIFQYDLNLNPITPDKVLTPKAYSWGASCIFNAGNYYILTTNSISTHTLYCYKYDANFNYQSTTQISNDGQWSQGVLFYGGYYYLAHHKGDHNRGNVSIDIYDINWNPVNTTTVTNFAIPTTTGAISYNANRPFLLMVGTKLYVSYDIEQYILPVNQKNWQAAVKVYQINGITGVNDLDEKNMFTIAPNPVDDNLTISSSYNTKDIKYEVIDNTGKLVLIGETKSVSLSGLRNGIYYLRISDAKDGTILQTKKLVKE